MPKYGVLYPFASVTGAVAQNAKFFASDVAVVDYPAEKLIISISENTGVKLDYTLDGGGTWNHLNGGNNLTADALYSESVYTGSGALFNLRTPTVGGTTINYCKVQFTGSDLYTRTLGTLTDTSITSPTNGQTLIYNSGSSQWQNKTPSDNVDIFVPNIPSITSGLTKYVGTGSATLQSTEENAQFLVSTGGTINKLIVNVGTNNLDGTTTFTVRKNKVDTTMVVSFATTITGAASDTTHTFTVDSGDLIDIKVVSAGTTGSLTNVTATLTESISVTET